MTSIQETVQSFSPGDIVTLFQMDARNLGSTILYFTPVSDDGNSVEFDGQTYVPVDLEATGFEWNGQGALPRPHIKVSNANKVFNALVIQYGDLLGSTITRIRTFRQYLDNGSDPDPLGTFPIEKYVISKKVSHNKVFIEWELSASIDQEGKILPGRQIIKDVCTHRYRVWDPDNTDDFNYDRVTCPYTDSAYFNAKGQAVGSPSLDSCGRKLTDCKLRFGSTAVLPFRGFPGVVRFV